MQVHELNIAQADKLRLFISHGQLDLYTSLAVSFMKPHTHTRTIAAPIYNSCGETAQD